MRQADLDADAILRLAGEWEAERGELVMLDWAPQLARQLGQHERAERFERDARWPTAGRVAAVFGSWNAMRAAQGRARTRTGISPDSPRHQRQLAESADPASVETGAWTLPEVLQALRDDYQEHGRWPTGVDWQAADPEGQRPTTETVKHVVGRDVLGTNAPGQFSIAVRLAGGDPLLPGERPTDRERRNRIKGLLAVDPDLSVVQIVQETGLHRSVVSRHLRWLREHGELPGPADPTDRRLARLWRADRTAAEIAEALGLTENQVKYRRNRLDLPKRGRRRAGVDQTALLELVRAHRTDAEIADALGVPLSTVLGGVAALRRSGHDLPDRRRRGEPLPDVDQTALLELVRAHKTDAEIADALGVSSTAVIVHVAALRRSGHDLPDRRRRRSRRSRAAAADQDTLIAMLSANRTDAEIAEALGVTYGAVIGRVAALRRSGYDLPDRRARRRRVPAADQDTLIAMLRADRTYAEIAGALGVPLSTITNRVAALRRSGHDLPRRRPGPRPARA